MTTPSAIHELLPIALDMTASLSSDDRSRRLVEAVRRAVPCDATALLRVDGDALVPVAALGLTSDLFGRRFPIAENPRFERICAQAAPTRFPSDSELPDPYDGLVEGAHALGGAVHSCLGCPLRVEGELVGVLTLDALEAGAFDGIGDDFLSYLAALAGAALRTNDLIGALERRAEREGLVARDLLRDAHVHHGALLLGESASMQQLRRDIDLVGASEFGVLVSGETGVGKELVVRALHAASARAERPLVYVNCAALPESIVESELFGHVRGAFTGAEGERPGKLRIADGATLFLDEIGELPLSVQPKLLRALQEGELQRVGSDAVEHVDLRILAATNRDLEAEVEAGRFRADLRHRLDVCRVRVPPLREHVEDVPILAGHFADLARRRIGTGPVRLSREVLAALGREAWPGNVREMENVVARSVLRASARVAPNETVHVGLGDLDLGHAPLAADGAAPTPSADAVTQPLREATRDFQRERIRDAVAASGGNWSSAARRLGLDRSNLHHLARRLGLK